MRFRSIPRVDPIDAALKFSGVALAGGSLVFASSMILAPDRTPAINGIEHLAIYAKPARHVAIRQPKPGAPAAPNIDYTPTGSTRKSLPPSIMIGYEFLEGSPTSALIRLPSGRVMRVARGQPIAGLGAVTAIRQQQSKWVVVTQAGSIRER
jgi:hypothetical protein